ncbi:fimbrial protein [Yersinia sp. 1652 StPb PI]|uniref:fimbrial protein n=1 Tax=unclassified Yersinia (in: enterobacteria) TaxID=2653513 RepID=UPI00355C4C7A
MHLNSFCRKKVLWVGLSLLVGGISINTHAVTLNFSASLVQGTCSLSLDKSVLSLGDVQQANLRSETLLNLQPVTLTVDNCNGAASASLQPVVIALGPGKSQNGKWLFRSSDSDVGGAGVMLVQSASQPSYASTEVKSGDYFPLAAVGQTPVNKQLQFFAGVSCGGVTDCATVKPGQLTANVNFIFAYR